MTEGQTACRTLESVQMRMGRSLMRMGRSLLVASNSSRSSSARGLGVEDIG